MQISNIKYQKSKIHIKNAKIFTFLVCVFGICFFIFDFARSQQDADLEFTLDVTSPTVTLPKIFKPNIDLSGRGFHQKKTWPQGLAAGEVLDTWQKDIGFSGIYRLQYNLWEINELAKEKDLQEGLLGNYEDIIKKVTEQGGIVILDIFGMPGGLGKVLDKKSAPLDLRAFKRLVKSRIRALSCDKRYNIWYELWSAPDLDDFFLGRKQEYLNLYRAVAEAIKELEQETKIHIPLGGPSVSWWFQNLDGNTIISPERSLIYELIKFCSRNHLPLDFITWHAYSSDPKTEKEITIYNKTAVTLIRDWLTYFNLDRNTPLIVDEWNYDREANVLEERHEKSHICASFIFSRLKNMYEAGLNYQLYYSLEDFQNNKEGINRNVGIFWEGGPKSTYNAFRMLSSLGNEMYPTSLKFNDEFVGVIATKAKDYIAIIVYNYIDPEIFRNYISRKISTLRPAERVSIIRLIKSDKLEKIMRNQLDVSGLRLTSKVKSLLNQAKELNSRATKFMTSPRNLNIGIKNLNPVRNKTSSESGISNGVKENYIYQRYAIDSACSKTCEFVPLEEKEITASEPYQELLSLSPYSVNMIILKKKPPEPESIATESKEEKPSQND